MRDMRHFVVHHRPPTFDELLARFVAGGELTGAGATRPLRRILLSFDTMAEVASGEAIRIDARKRRGTA